MDFNTYQKAAGSTAQEKAFSLDYLIPMIVGETGELFGQRAKSHWHGWSADKLQVELVSEYGDICWGVAIFLGTQGVHILPPLPVTAKNSYGALEADNPWQALLSRACYLNMWYTDDTTLSYLKAEAISLWYALERNAEAITGMPFGTVLQANLTKLAGRVARGTLVGSGDHR